MTSNMMFVKDKHISNPNPALKDPPLLPRLKRFIVLVIFLCLFSLIVVFCKIIDQHNTKNPNSLIDNPKAASDSIAANPSPTVAVTTNPSATPTAAPTVTDNNGITSGTNLGVSLKVNDSDSTTALTKRSYGMHIDGDKIYVGYADSAAQDQDEYVEVFSKSPSDNLVTAITKTILNGYSSTDCPVNFVSGFNSYFPSSYQIAVIHYATDPYKESVSGEPYSGSLSCPEPYTPHDYVAYFVMDPAHPDVFAFLYLGNGALPNYNGKAWPASLTFN